MRKLPEVLEAKELMNEAMDWSAFKWLFEKPRVRQTADRANEALDRLNRRVKTKWSDEHKTTYRKLSAGAHGGGACTEKEQQPAATDSQLELLIDDILKADQAAHRARMRAEEIFDEAERQMNTSLAREGCKKAIHSWELHEKAIRKAEAIAGAGEVEE
jgi:hypothetical protein